MRHIAVDHEASGSQDRRYGHLLLSVLLSLFLSICWAANQWEVLSHLILPDADDMMRLAQVRDWLAGQAINDWTQYRMGPPLGAQMHWSRLNDLGPAALILAGRPLFGQFGAELFAVLAYPALLFVGHLYLCARIGRRVWGRDAALVSLILGALAYPGTTVFSPGRIDHHALQVVLMELSVLALMRRASLVSGGLFGAVLALSLIVGLEIAPQAAALLGVAALFWIVRGEAERERLLGAGLALAAVTLPFLLFLRPTVWPSELCDAFTPATSTATLAGGAALALLGLCTPRLGDWRARLGVGGAVGTATLSATLAAYPTCLTGPYGQVDPFLRREFIPHITEANGIFSDLSIGRGMQLEGLMMFALAGAAWVAWRYRSRWWRWAPLLAVVASSGVVAIFQVRGTYIGAPVSAPLLAGLVLAARRLRRPAVLVAAWCACAGMGWYTAPMLAESLIQRTDGPGKDYLTPISPRALCRTSETWAELDRYPPGVIMVPTSMAAYVIGATRMSTVAAGYHRNNAANMDLYRFFLSPPDQGAQIARRWNVRYVAFCPTDFGEMDVERRFPNSLATLLAADRAPAGWQRLPLRGSRLRLYRIAP